MEKAITFGQSPDGSCREDVRVRFRDIAVDPLLPADITDAAFVGEDVNANPHGD